MSLRSQKTSAGGELGEGHAGIVVSSVSLQVPQNKKFEKFEIQNNSIDGLHRNDRAEESYCI